MPYPVLSKIPLLRVLIPFATGIVAAQYQSSIWWSAYGHCSIHRIMAYFKE